MTEVKQQNQAAAHSGGTSNDLVRVPPEPYYRWVYTARNRRTSDEVHSKRIETARREFRPAGSQINRTWQRILFELSTWCRD